MFNTLVFNIVLLISLIQMDYQDEQLDISIKLINNSSFKLSNILIFSLKLDDLGLNAISKYEKLDFNLDSDDAMIYLSANNKRFARYLAPISISGKYSYFIDSLDIDNKFIYLRIIKE